MTFPEIVHNVAAQNALFRNSLTFLSFLSKHHFLIRKIETPLTQFKIKSIFFFCCFEALSVNKVLPHRIFIICFLA